MALSLVERLPNLTPRVEPVDGGSDAAHMLKFKTFDITFDNSYLTGGEALTAAQVGLGTVLCMIAGAVGGRVFEYDYAGATLKAFQDAATALPLAEVPNATDLSLTTVRCMFIGTAV
jgi:hypothetical protein